MARTHLSDVVRYNAWATEALIAFLRGLGEERLDLSAPGTYGTIRATLVHLVGANERYAARMAGDAGPGPDSLDEEKAWPGLDALVEHLRSSSARLERLAESVPPGQQLEGVWRGRPFSMPAGALFAQAINHADEHRGHIGTVLGANGIEPPELDGWAWGERALGARYE